MKKAVPVKHMKNIAILHVGILYHETNIKINYGISPQNPQRHKTFKDLGALGVTK